MTVERLRANRRRAPRGRVRIPAPVVAALLVAAGVSAGLVASRKLEIARLPLPSVGAWLRAERFTVHHVDWIGLQALRGEDLVASLGLRPGTPLLDLDTDALARRLEPHPRIARVRALRIPPDRLLVAVEERRPLGILEPSGEAFDAEGRRFPLAPGEGDGLPRVTGDPAAAADLLRAARERGLALESIRAAKGDVRFRPEGREVDVRIGDEAGAGLDAWLRVAESGIERRHGASEVDLRFRGSAVLRAPENDVSNRGGRDEP